ncbi:MAG: hypothetical protein AAF798_08625 [Bacteroidota bacterium]
MKKKIHLAFTTHAVTGASPSFTPVLLIRDHEKDIIRHTTEVKGKIEVASSHLVTADVPEEHHETHYEDIRVGLTGAQNWYPHTVFLFEELQEEGKPVETHPIALRPYLPSLNMVNVSEGALLLPLNKVSLGNSDTTLNRVLLLIKNSPGRNSGTKNGITIMIQGKSSTLMQFNIAGGPLKKDGAFLMTVFDFTECTSSDIASIELSIQGDDQWKPAGLWMYGIDNRVDEIEHLVSLVSIADWSATDLGPLSTDPKEGTAKKLLYKAYR